MCAKSKIEKHIEVFYRKNTEWEKFNSTRHLKRYFEKKDKKYQDNERYTIKKKNCYRNNMK